MVVAQEEYELANQSGRGRQATSPQKISRKGWIDIAWRIFHEIGDDRVPLIAAGATYFMLLALVPTLSAIVAVYGLFTDPAEVIRHVNLLEGVVPSGGMDIVREQLERLTEQHSSTLGLTLFISLAIALWSSSAGVKSLFEAMNIAYDEKEKRNFFVVSALALIFTFCGVLAVLMLIGVVVIMPAILSAFSLGGFAWLVRVATYGVMMVLLSLGIAALYHWGPSRNRAKWRWITPGTIFSVVMIAIISAAFSYYVANFANYNATYGSLGALIGFLTWVWLTIIAMIVGAEVNSEVEHQTAMDSTEGPAKPMGSRGAHMADHVGKSVGWDEEHKNEKEDAGAASSGRRTGPSILTLGLAVPAAFLARRFVRGRR